MNQAVDRASGILGPVPVDGTWTAGLKPKPQTHSPALFPLFLPNSYCHASLIFFFMFAFCPSPFNYKVKHDLQLNE